MSTVAVAHTQITFSDVARAARRLSPEEEHQIASVAMEHVEMFLENQSIPARPPEVQAKIKEIMSKPLDIIPREEFLAMLRKYNPAL